jgi:hypothetical protein
MDARMTDDTQPRTIQTTMWTSSLLKDLLDALRAKRDDATVREFAKELMDDKDLPLSYLVKKTKEIVGQSESERLDVLVRGRYMVEKEKTEQTKAKGGFLSGLMRKFKKD